MPASLERTPHFPRPNAEFLRLKSRMTSALDTNNVRGLAYMALAVVAVQGAGYMFQLVIAFIFTPVEFGVVRSIDAVLALLVILGSAGMPSLAVKCVAEVDGLEVRGRLLARLILIAGGAGFVVASVACASAAWVVNANTVPYFQRIVWLVPLAACARTTLNYYQGSHQVRRYALLSSSIAGAVLPLALLAASVGGLTGWISARYAAEAVTVVAALAPLASMLRRGPLAPEYSFGRLVRVGGVLSLSLLVRTSLDNLGTLALIIIGVPTSEIGYYGVGGLAVLGLLILPACVGNLALPKLARVSRDPEMLRQTFGRTVWTCVALTLPLSVAGIAVTPALVRHGLPAYAASIPVIQVLLLATLPRALTMASGTLLVAVDRVHTTLLVNLLCLSVGAVLMLALTPPFGIAGTACAAVGVEAISATIYGFQARRALAVPRDRTLS
jgi:O-antigen/teichoic acid export membrane protein